jgi:GrpB-like predicted nucleotidyltransferase (UPF0157 family)
MTIVVSEYDPSWPETFASIKAELERILAGVDVVAIEHVGSTSVPALAAKPVIDIDVVVRRETLAQAIAAMERGGYVYFGERGIRDRHEFKIDDGVRRNTYVCIEGCRALRNHLAVRDVLRADPELREEYAAVKRRLAAMYDHAHIDLYVEGKSEVLRRILRRGGLSDDELDEIEQDNRAVNTVLQEKYRPA